MYTRQNVYADGGGLSDPTLLYYALAVREMQKLDPNNPLSWAFFAAIHGLDPDLWPQLGLPLPNPQPTFLAQCQHGSWYFLPWHRGYLLAIEGILRNHVAQLGGPADSWAIPYWNYFDPNESQLPPAFASPLLPNGTPGVPDGTANPLYTPQRYGLDGTGKNITIPLTGNYAVNLNAMGVPHFTGVASGGDPGFGGVDTGFSHGGSPHGDIENQPHDYVHGIVGGQTPDPNSPGNYLPGLMADPDTAGYDPIFWLHHANIDRLWQVWILNPPQPGVSINPKKANWLGGPGTVGGRVFAMPMVDGSTWNFTPKEVQSTDQLGYSYTELQPQAPFAAPTERLATLGLTALAVPVSGRVMPQTGQNVELVGANDAPLSLVGTEARTIVQIDPTAHAKVAASLSAVSAFNATANAEAMLPVPDRVFLNIENVTASVDGSVFHVYVSLPEGADPADHPELLAGDIALFGARKASQVDGEHGGQGLTFVLEITRIVDQMHLSDSFNVDRLPVRLVSLNPIPEGVNVKIGRVSIYRQGR